MDSIAVNPQETLNCANWIAIVGAGAWLPWIYKLILLFIRPIIRIKMFRDILTITNAANGPIITLPLSIVVKIRSVNIKNMIVIIVHTKSEEKKVYDFFASSDVSIRSLVSNGQRVDQLEITPSGIIPLEPNKSILRDFSFSNKENIDGYEQEIFSIRKRVFIEKQKKSEFIVEEQYLQSLDEIIRLKADFERLSTWQTGEYSIVLEINVFEKKRPYVYNFKGVLEGVKATHLKEDLAVFNSWITSPDSWERGENPSFRFANMLIETTE